MEPQLVGNLAAKRADAAGNQQGLWQEIRAIVSRNHQRSFACAAHITLSLNLAMGVSGLYPLRLAAEIAPTF